LRFVGTDRLLYGSDCPFTPDRVVVKLAEVMTAEMGKIWSGEERRAVLVGNARRLLGTGDSCKL
jgi:predicted TIM-barrel fold metal-dependent hydrolase